MDEIQIQAPFDEDTIRNLHAGDIVRICGDIYGARDSAHARLVDAITRGESLPVDLNGQVIFYVGPAPAKPGKVIGPAGPTTSSRMDPYTIILLQHGVKGFIGKGNRSNEVKNGLIQHHAVYLAAIGGAAALLSKHIKTSQIVAYADLGTEAIYKFRVEHFPAVVVNDVYGGDAYISGREQFLRKQY